MASKAYEINENKYERFDQKNIMFFRRLWDKSLPTHGKFLDTNVEKHISSKKEGYSRVDFALAAAGWTIYEKFSNAFDWERKEIPDMGYGVEWMRTKFQVKEPHSFTTQIKKTARFLGASVVGITSINDKWIYKTGFMRPNATSESEAKKDVRDGKSEKNSYETPINLPEGIDKAIIMAIEMDKDAISTAPAQPASATTAVTYSKMAFVISCLGEFIRNLGYRAVQSGNDTALSIPLAVDAGLGALGRNGLLITPKYGPRVRICKVFTDLPLIIDTPNLEFIKKMKNYCGKCLNCANACKTAAISRSIEPFFNPESISNNPGVKKYHVNPEKCFEFWVENSSDCGSCIAACPFSKIEKSITPNEFWFEK